jgi:septum formation protein
MADTVLKNIRLICLASASPRRRELVEKFGLPVYAFSVDADEHVPVTDPAETVMKVADNKAAAALDVKTPGPGEVILTADTSVWLDGEMLGKPKDESDARDMLRRLSGRTHNVYTAFRLAYPLRQRSGAHAEGYETPTLRIRGACVRTAVRVSELSEEEIDVYIASGDPMDKAGAYGIQGAFGVHVSGIDGDYNNVVGLPVSAIYDALKKADEEILTE